MERVGHAVTVAKGSFESKELLLCFALLGFYLKSNRCSASVSNLAMMLVGEGRVGRGGRRPHALQ